MKENRKNKNTRGCWNEAKHENIKKNQIIGLIQNNKNRKSNSKSKEKGEKERNLIKKTNQKQLDFIRIAHFQYSGFFGIWIWSLQRMCL